MATTAGTVTLSCPGCHRPLVLPIHVDTVRSTTAGVELRLTADHATLAAHLLTHTDWDGEPISVLAAAA